jgi:hypothetical protein
MEKNIYTSPGISKNQYDKYPPALKVPNRVGVVGFGRSGTTIVREVTNEMHKLKGTPQAFRTKTVHWYNKNKPAGVATIEREQLLLARKGLTIIICKRDLRDVLASGFRHNEKFYTEGYDGYKRLYNIPDKELIEYGNKHVTEGWKEWLPHVDYTFCYEDYMSNPRKAIRGLAKAIHFEPVTDDLVDRLLKAALDWKQSHPQHISSTKGRSNAWHDVFNKHQEKIIIDNWGDWLQEQGYKI